jgi:hypothetical protein
MTGPDGGVPAEADRGEDVARRIVRFLDET